MNATFMFFFFIFFFFFNDTATTEIYTLSLHDALPIAPTPASGRSGRGTRARSKAIRRTHDAALGDDRRDEPRGRDVEGRVEHRRVARRGLLPAHPPNFRRVAL